MVLIGWSNPDGYIGESLGGLPVYPTDMTIDSISRESDGSIRAEGTFGLHDCIEDSRGNDPWEAVGVPNGETIDWTVKRKSEGEFCFQSNDGEFLFTMVEEINIDIKAFIADRLNFSTKTLLNRA